MRRGYLFALLGLVVLSGLAVVIALKADPSDIGAAVDPSDLPVLADSVPGPAAASGWINSEPLASSDLEGKVVVYDFWTYSCVNCVRTLPHLEAWYARYASDGLVIVGVHSPEFDFEKDPANVQHAVASLGVQYPVALDPDMDVWDAFANQYWPAKYIVDRDGRLRYVHYGEGAYDETEDVLRSLLGVDSSSPRASAAGPDDAVGTADETPETYLGSLRGTTASPEGLRPGTNSYSVPSDVPQDAFALDGSWTVTDESVTAAAPGAAIVLHYRASEVNLVLGGTGSVRVSVDGGPAMTVDVDAHDLFNLLRDGPSGDHVVRIEVDPGIAAYAFTFG
jgi:thiol-disulfide isomerase/thioredoxin